MEPSPRSPHTEQISGPSFMTFVQDLRSGPSSGTYVQDLRPGLRRDLLLPAFIGTFSSRPSSGDHLLLAFVGTFTYRPSSGDHLLPAFVGTFSCRPSSEDLLRLGLRRRIFSCRAIVRRPSPAGPSSREGPSTAFFDFVELVGSFVEQIIKFEWPCDIEAVQHENIG